MPHQNLTAIDIDTLECVFINDYSSVSPAKLAAIDKENSALHEAYNKEYYGQEFIDLSFYVISNSQILATIFCHKIQDQLTFLGKGCQIESPNEDKKLIEFIISHLHSLALQYHCSEIAINDAIEQGKLTALGVCLLNKRFSPAILFDMSINLQNLSETLFFKNLRKSYKSLINWGKKNFNVYIMDSHNLDYDAFDKFKEFHCKIAGRKTRSDKSWDIQFELIQKGQGELILAYFKDNLAGGSLFLDQGDNANYFTGVYERELFQYGISHYLVYLGIVRAAQKGKTKYCSLGLFDTNCADEKLYNIQFFKKGFCKDLKPVIVWKKSFTE